jgi:RNA polymerase sigma factor for flagellar operon FliA
MRNQGLRAYQAQSTPPSEAAQEARRQIVEEHAGLVRTVARRIYRRLPSYARGFDEEDLVSAGILGLLEAHERFDEDAGIPFPTFAEFRVKGAILDELRRHDFFPQRLRRKANKLQKTEKQLEQDLGRPPTDDEVAEEMELSSEELVKLRNETKAYSFVDSDDAHITLRSPNPDPLFLVRAKELRNELIKQLKDLPDREKLVMDLYFNRELMLKEIADILGVTEGRVSQIKSAAIKRLRIRMREYMD